MVHRFDLELQGYGPIRSIVDIARACLVVPDMVAIGRLPYELRTKVNTMLRDGVKYSAIIKFLEQQDVFGLNREGFKIQEIQRDRVHDIASEIANSGDLYLNRNAIREPERKM